MARISGNSISAEPIFYVVSKSKRYSRKMNVFLVGKCHICLYLHDWAWQAGFFLSRSINSLSVCLVCFCQLCSDCGVEASKHGLHSGLQWVKKGFRSPQWLVRCQKMECHIYLYPLNWAWLAFFSSQPINSWFPWYVFASYALGGCHI